MCRRHKELVFSRSLCPHTCLVAAAILQMWWQTAMEPVAESHSVNSEPKSMLVALLREQGEGVPRCGVCVPYVWNLPLAHP